MGNIPASFIIVNQNDKIEFQEKYFKTEIYMG